jgi:hypothetical protein
MIIGRHDDYMRIEKINAFIFMNQTIGYQARSNLQRMSCLTRGPELDMPARFIN